jgi:hypothetical protein
MSASFVVQGWLEMGGADQENSDIIAVIAKRQLSYP